VRGRCAAINKPQGQKMFVSPFDCTKCGACLKLGCSALKVGPNGTTEIDPNLCYGENCRMCAQVCPKHAITRVDEGV
jgi:indolepyruvate ferredoxin oxidoreductase alpha subunit